MINTELFSSAEEALAFTDTVFKSSSEYSIIATDRDGSIMLWNEGARRLYGYETQDVVGRSWHLLQSEGFMASDVPEQIESVVLSDGTWRGQLERVRKDGSTFIAGVVITPRRSRAGEISGMLMISRDITEELRLARQLARAQAYGQSLLESAPDAMLIVNQAGEIQMANAEAETLFGYSREQIVGQQVEALIPERFRSKHPHYRELYFAHPRTRPMGEGLDLWGRRRDGSEFPAEISLSPLETEDGLVAISAIRDATERKRFEQELRQANLELKSASQAKDRFLASMSHELRTPLNAILGFAGTLLMGIPGPLNEDQLKQLRIVKRNGKHLLSLINDLLDLARVESEAVEYQPQPIECQQFLDEVVGGLKPLADAKGIVLEVVTLPESVTVSSDRRALKQILINLLNNAIKFTDKGTVQLRLSRDEHEGKATTVLSVIDTGRGIKVEDQQKLFDAFQQIDSSHANPYEGTGLGLYLCRKLATFIGARITMQSEFGVGSTFTVELES